jgi:hypothetical protein
MIPGAVTARELKEMREAQEAFMPTSIRVYNKVSVGDGEYDYAPDFTTKGRITTGFGIFRAVADRYQGVSYVTISVPWDTDVRAGQRLYDAYGRAFEVRDVKDANTFQTAKVCLCEGVEDAVSR